MFEYILYSTSLHSLPLYEENFHLNEITKTDQFYYGRQLNFYTKLFQPLNVNLD